MKKHSLAVALTFAALAGAFPAHAQAPATIPSAATRYEAGLLMEKQGDDKAAFIAFLEAAEAGHTAAQRRLGELYDSGNAAVPRNFPESIRWYERARLGGEQIPSPRSPMPTHVPLR